MADFSLPVLTSLYGDMVDTLKARDTDLALWLDGTTTTNLPNNAKRWNSTNNNFEKFNGSTWAPLSTKYMINVDYVDGCTVNDSGTSLTDLWTASKVTSALLLKVNVSDFTGTNILDKLKLVDGAGSGLDADLLDGMNATSTNTASSVVARDSSGNFSAGTITANLTGTASTASTATTLTGLTSTVAELNFSDGVTSNIQTQLNGKLATTATAADSAKLNGVASAETATASTIVKRDASGYIYGAGFNSTLPDTATASTHYYVETGSDGWLRPKTLANVKAELNAGLAPLASPALTGTPTAPTAPAGTNTTQLATTAFVLNTLKHTAGAVVEAQSNTAFTSPTDTTASTKKKAFEARVGVGGVVTVSFSMAASQNSASYYTYGQIHVNGVAVGTLRTATLLSYTTFTENITVNAGDLVQIYIYGNTLDVDRPSTANYFKILTARSLTTQITFAGNAGARDV